MPASRVVAQPRLCGGPPSRLLCPHDLDGLDEAVIEAARRSHPFVVADGARERNGLFRDDGHEGTFDGELPPPPRSVPRTSFSRERVRMVRPLAGRIKPSPNQLTGRGLWLVNELCDLVQIRSDDTGTVVRVHGPDRAE